MGCWIPHDTSGALRGRPLRYLLVKMLKDAGRPLSVQELIVRCADEGVVFTARPSKIISDALRWERAAGRVRHLRRGVYEFGRVPRSTMRWISHRTEQSRSWLAWCSDQTGPPRATSDEVWIWNPRSSIPDWPAWRAPIQSETFDR